MLRYQFFIRYVFIFTSVLGFSVACSDLNFEIEKIEEQKEEPITAVPDGGSECTSDCLWGGCSVTCSGPGASCACYFGVADCDCEDEPNQAISQTIGQVNDFSDFTSFVSANLSTQAICNQISDDCSSIQTAVNNSDWSLYQNAVNLYVLHMNGLPASDKTSINNYLYSKGLPSFF